MDWDLVVAGPGTAETMARDLAETVQGHYVLLNKTFHQYRVLDHGRQYDVQPLPEDGIDSFLRNRDYSVNAMAIRLQSSKGWFMVHDPVNGFGDLTKKDIRPMPGALISDPVRILRGLRISLELGLRIPKSVLTEMKTAALDLWTSAPERIRYELFRILDYWPEQARQVALGLDLVLGSSSRRRARLKRLLRLSRHPGYNAMVLFAASSDHQPSMLAQRLCMTRAQIRFLRAWERVEKHILTNPRTWLLELLRSRENPAELSYLAMVAGNVKMRHWAMRNHAFAQALRSPLIQGGAAARLAGVSGPVLGKILAALQVEQALGNIRTHAQARVWLVKHKYTFEYNM